jgi:hypothetical protein
MRASGKLVKAIESLGGKEFITRELYKKHVVSARAPMTNGQFIEMIQDVLSMSKACATTYTYKVRKDLGVSRDTIPTI